MDHRPLRPLDRALFYIMKALETGEQHGFGIIETLPRIAERDLRFFGPFQLYRTLQTMLNQGWIEEAGDRKDPVDELSVARRHYRLTDAGRAEMWAEALRRENVANAEYKFGVGKP